MSKPVTQVEDMYVFECPHCDGTVVVSIHEVNCKIFRHAVNRTTGEQLNPHASQHECETLCAQGVLLGCGKPFQLTYPTVQPCDYI